MSEAPPAGILPYLTVRDAARAAAFYVEAFGATEIYRLTDADGRVGHAELELAGHKFMLADEYPDYGCLGPASLGGTPVSLTVYVPDVDQAVERAVAAGAKVDRPAADQFYGCRTAWLSDPFGHAWVLQQRLEIVSPAEMQKRFRAL
ncbi:MAG: VOC family protein [bacterium]|nr:VOC family protein [bacterium]